MGAYLKKKYDHYYWMLDQRFDFLIPRFQKYFGIDERKQITFVGSFHGPSRAGEEWNGVTKELVRKNERGKLIYAGPEDNENSAGGNAVWLEPEDVNLAYRDHIITDGDTLVVSFSGVNLPEEVDSFIATGAVASKLNSKWEQFLLLTDREEIKLEANTADDRRKELNEYLNKEGSDIVIRNVGTFGSDHIAVIRNSADAEWYCNSLKEPDLENRFFKSPYTPLNSKNNRKCIDLDGADGWKTKLKNEIDSFFQSSKSDQILIEDNEGTHIVIISNSEDDKDWYCDILENGSLPSSLYISRYSLSKILTPETIELRLNEEFPYKRREKLTNSVQELMVNSRSKRVVIKKPDTSGGYRMCVATNTDEVKKYCGLLNEEELDGTFLVSEYIPHKQSFAGMGIVSKAGKRSGKAKVTYCGLTEQVLYHELAYEGLIWPAFWDFNSKKSEKTRKDDAKKITKSIGEKLANLGYFGFYNVDFIEEEKTGRMYVAEINARFGFCTILYALFCGKETFFDAIQGNNPPKLNDENIGDYRILLGKIKGITGKQYKGLFSHSDIETWYKEGDSFRTYYLRDEVFEYGSSAGLFGEKIPAILERKTALTKFMDICLLRGKRLVSMYVDSYCGFAKECFNFDLIKQYLIKRETKYNIKFRKFEENGLLDFWNSDNGPAEDRNVTAVTMIAGINGSGKTTLMRLVIKWISQLAIGQFPSETGALIFENGDGRDILITFTNGKADVGYDKQNVYADLSHISNIEVIQNILQDVGLLYYADTMTDIEIDRILPDQYQSIIDKGILHDVSKLNQLNNEIFVHDYDLYPLRRVTKSNRNLELKQTFNTWKTFGADQLPFSNIRLIVRRIEDQSEYTIKIDNADNNSINNNLPLSELAAKINESDNNGDIILFWFVWGIISAVLKRVSLNRNSLLGEISGNAGRLINDCSRTGDLETMVKEANTLDPFNPLLMESDMNKLAASISEISRVLKTNIDNQQIIRTREKQFDVYTLNLFNLKKDSEQEKIWLSFFELSINHTLENLTCGRVYFDMRFPSSGESNKSGLYNCISQCEKIEKNTILSFLDEPDNTYHMEWQQNLIKDIIKKYHVFSKKNMQIFVSSHSSVLLSDFPDRAQITFERNENFEKTQKPRVISSFGQQNYTICHESFGMDSIVGKFAEDTIKAIDLEIYRIATELEAKNSFSSYERVTQLKRKLEACRQIVYMVQEPLVGTALRRRYNWCRKELDNRVVSSDTNKNKKL